MRFRQIQLRVFRPENGVVVLLLSALLLARPSIHADQQEDALASLSLKELADAPVVLSSKGTSELFEAPTGSFVFDSDTIATLPVDSIPELLRYSPGVHIIRPSNGIWGIGMRGINSRFFNRVQFTVDEQNVYGSIFAGLFGSQHDLMMQDISSVEVAYGPGGGTWGNNAVNGRVNVLMKTAFETEGSLLRARIGTESRSLAGRVGWALDDSSSARVYLQGGQRESSLTRFDYSNAWDTGRAGFRFDNRLSSKDLISVSSELFYSGLGYAYNLADFATGDLRFVADDEMIRGGNAQLKWTRNSSDDSAYSVRSWFGYTDYDAPYAAFSMGLAGIEGRGRFRINDVHLVNVNIGGSYDEERTSSTLASDFTKDFLHNFAAFAGFQDEWTLIPGTLDLSWGLDARYEEKSAITTASPNLRVIYKINPSRRVWFSYSQAKRTTPVSLSVIESLRSGKRLDTPTVIPMPDGGSIVLDRGLTDATSSRELDAERLDAVEVGFRSAFSDARGSFSFNAFAYWYDDIFARIGVTATPRPFADHPFIQVEGGYDNLLEGEAYGFEAYLDWRFSEALRAGLSYSRLTDSFSPLVSSSDPFVRDSIQFSLDEFDHSAPGHMSTATVTYAFTENWELSNGLRYSCGYAFAKGKQPAVFQLDSRLSWRKSDSATMSLVGRNLLDRYTQEARLKDFFGHWTELSREIYLELKAEF